MKKLQTLRKMAMMCIAMALVAACSSDDSGSGTGGGNTGGYIKAKINGTNFETLEIMGQSTVVATRIGTGSEMIISVQGSSGQLESIVIGLHGVSGTGTYPISPDTDSFLAFVNSNTTVSYDTSNCEGATGSLTITTINDEKVEGTFSFVGKEDENCSQSKNVTEGSFRGVFMQQ